MNLAFALFEYFPYGGLQRDMFAMAEEALARGHQVTLFTRQWQGELPGGAELRLLPVTGASNHARDAAFAAAVAQQWQRFDRRVGFNKMPGLDWYYAADGCLAARYTGLKTLLPRYRTKLAMERSVFDAASHTRILSISPPQRALYQHHYGTADGRFVDLPPGIRRDRGQPDDVLARRAALRQQLGLDERTPVLLFVGSGFRTKGLDRAIGALTQLPEARFYVVGADRPDRYRRQAAKLGVAERVHFMGGQDNVPDWLFAADVLLHPAYAENTGTVLLEAAIAGLPVLTTEVCGYAPYIEQGAIGTVLGEADAAAVAAATRRLLAVPREQWRAAGRRFAAEAAIYDLVPRAVDALEQA